MKRLAIAVGVCVLAAAAVAGPFDFVNKVAPTVPHGATAAKYSESAQKGVESFTVDTPEGRQKIGQAVALAATAKYNGLDDRDSVQAYVTLVGLTVAKAADPNESRAKYVFGVLDSSDATACSGPGAYIMITRGALDMMEDESELAGVLAHEIAHVYKNHGMEAVKTAKRMDAVTGAASAADSHVAAFNNASDNFVSTVLQKGYSRGQEGEADKLAIQFLTKAGYDPQGYVRFLKKLEAAKATSGGAFATHPATKDRVKIVDKLATGTGATLADRFQKNVKRG